MKLYSELQQFIDIAKEEGKTSLSEIDNIVQNTTMPIEMLNEFLNDITDSKITIEQDLQIRLPENLDVFIKFCGCEDALPKYIDAIRKEAVSLSETEREELIKKMEKKDGSVKLELAESYLPLVVQIAYEYSIKKASKILDWIQDGNTGLLNAIENYKPSLEYPLTVYVSWFIRANILYSISQWHFEIGRFPNIKMIQRRQVELAYLELLQKTGKAPTPKDISLHINMPFDLVQEIWLRG